MTEPWSADEATTAQAQARVSASFFRRQLVLAATAGAVVLGCVVVVAEVVDRAGAAAHVVLRPAADGSGIRAVSPVAESYRSTLWAAGLALVAVAVVLTLLLDHMFRVARFSVLSRPSGRPRRDAAPEAAQEDR